MRTGCASLRAGYRGAVGGIVAISVRSTALTASAVVNTWAMESLPFA